jgi:hypothetical protein
MITTSENNPCKKSRHRGGQVDSMRSRDNAGGPGSGTRRMRRRARGPAAAERSVARRGLVSTQVGGRSSSVSALSQAQRQSGDRDSETHSHPHRVLYPHRHSHTALLSPSSLLCVASTSQSHPTPAPSSNPKGTHPCLRRRGAVLGVRRCCGPAVTDPGPAPLGRCFFGDGAAAGC